MGELLECLEGIAVGAIIVVPLYLFVFGGLERLLTRDERDFPKDGTYQAANKRAAEKK